MPAGQHLPAGHICSRGCDAHCRSAVSVLPAECDLFLTGQCGMSLVELAIDVFPIPHQSNQPQCQSVSHCVLQIETAGVSVRAACRDVLLYLWLCSASSPHADQRSPLQRLPCGQLFLGGTAASAVEGLHSPPPPSSPMQSAPGQCWPVRSQCPLGSRESTPPSPTSDRQCSPCKFDNKFFWHCQTIPSLFLQ